MRNVYSEAGLTFFLAAVFSLFHEERLEGVHGTRMREQEGGSRRREIERVGEWIRWRESG